MNNKIDVIRAWKDQSYRNSLSKEQLAQLPANPAGNLVEEEMSMVILGGRTSKTGGCGYDTCEMK